jgi:hypothetical protein
LPKSNGSSPPEAAKKPLRPRIVDVTDAPSPELAHVAMKALHRLSAFLLNIHAKI